MKKLVFVVSELEAETENIMLDLSRTKVKIIDLGLSIFCNEDEQLSTFCGSPDFAAPGLIC